MMSLPLFKSHTATDNPWAPAELLGVADRLGTLAPGRDADIVALGGDGFMKRLEATFGRKLNAKRTGRPKKAQAAAAGKK